MIVNKTLNSASPEETLAIGRRLGVNLHGGEVIELVSDLGGGKTTLTKGIAEGAGSRDKVHSPSFTIENEYRAKDLTIHHIDFYRLNDPGIMKDELIERLEDPKGLVIIEWADIVEDLLPENRLVVRVKAEDENSRQFNLSCTDDLSYLMDGLE